MYRRHPLAFVSSLIILVAAIGVLWGPTILYEARFKLAAYGSDTYAVYLDSGHIFYGSIRSITGSTIVLANVRSFQNFQVGQNTTNTLQAQIDNPITKPDNFLILNRSHVLFFEKVGLTAPVISTGAHTQ